MSLTTGRPQPALVDGRTVIGLLLGPAIGAVLETLLARLSHGPTLDMAKSIQTYLQGGYILLPLLAIALILLRAARIDSLIVCAIVGFAIGLLFLSYHYVGDPGWGQYVFQGGLPFAMMLLAARLIAGRRA